MYRLILLEFEKEEIKNKKFENNQILLNFN